jgi:hypothetical protein
VNTTSRRVILWILNAIGALVGVWALLLPHEFHASFPGLGFGAWVAADGPFNEHLLRDVGALYLALVGAGIVAALNRRADAGVAVGVAWLVFSVPHLAYHAAHLQGLPPLDAIGQPIALAATIVLAVPLVVPPRARSNRTASIRTTQPEQETIR